MRKLATILAIIVVSGLRINAANFTSIATGSWSAPSTWSIVGASATGIPTQVDNVTITSGFTVTLNAVLNYGKNVTTNVGGTLNCNAHIFNIYGNLTNNGTLTGTTTLFFHNTGTISSSTTIINPGNWSFQGITTIAAGTVISKQNGFTVNSGFSLTNNGSATLAGSVNMIGTAVYVNGPNAILNVSTNVTNATGTGTFNCSAVGNTVTYNSNNYSSVFTNNATYYNLTLNTASAQTKALSGNLVVLNKITIGANVTLNWANHNITIGGHWTNAGNLTCTNMGTITFNGAGNQNITRTAGETFNNVTLAGTGSVKLLNDMTVTGTTTLTSGTLNPNTFIYHQKGVSWLGNGGACSIAAAGEVIFEGGVNQTIGGTVGTTFGNVEINNLGFSVSLTIDQTAAGTTTLTAGTLDPAAFTWHQTGASWMGNGGGVNTSATGDITFDGSVIQAIDGTVGSTFGNIMINSTSAVNLARDLNVSGTLTIAAGILDVTGALFNINLSGDFVHNGGSLLQRTGTVFFNGPVAQTLSGSSTTTFYNATSNNVVGGVSVTGIIIITNILQVNSRSFGTAGIGSIILTATGATTYSRIGTLGATASLTGTGWSIGSYIDGPATAYWQYLGSPVTSATLADWDNDARFYMSGVGGNDGNSCCPIFYSVRTYAASTATYNNVMSTGTTLAPARGFMVWMSDNLASLTAPLPFDTKGTPNQGTVLRSVIAGGPGSGYNLVSNPYACPITYASVVASSGNLGPNFVILTETGSYVTNPNGGVIAPAQGFMCVATSNGNMKFLESAKTTAVNPNIIRQAEQQNYLTIISGNSTNGLGGQTDVHILTDAHNGYDADYDMPFLSSPYDDATNIYTSDNDGKDLLLNALDGTNDVLDIPLSVIAGTPGDQLLTFKGINSFTDYSCTWVEDLATGQKINLKDHDTYSFPANAAGEKHNFNLHFERNATCPLNEQNITASLDANSLVFVNNGNILVQFGFAEKTDVTVNVFNAIGQEVTAAKNVTVSNETITLDNPGAHGVYLVRIKKGEEVVTKKIYL